jgi:hypothetical protein
MPGKEADKQATVKISLGVFTSAEEFLRTARAKELGLDSMKDVVNQAVVEFLKQHSQSDDESYRKLVEFFDKNPQLLKNIGFDSTGQLVQTAIEQFKATKATAVARRQRNEPGRA